MTNVLLMAARQLSYPILLFVLMVADYRTRKRIYESTIRRPHGSLRNVRRFRSSFREDVDNVFAGGDEVVGDDAAMTSPPHGFSAHDGAAPCMSDLAKPA
jgi:hypothetical protein